MTTTRLTMSQAIIKYLMNQYVERDGVENLFFAGCFGIFGHGNVAGVGQALQQYPEFTYYQTRNEQAMVHTAAAYTKMKNRLQTMACTTSIGPGASNMLTGAAAATVNRLPVLLLPGDIFSRRNVNPVLQQIESTWTQDISVNDAFKPVSKYWDRINRPEQVIAALPESMRIMTSPAETGVVTLCLPQDVQAEAFDYPSKLFEKKVWRIRRPRADVAQLKQAVEMIKASKKPIIVAGGGVIYSEATDALAKFVEATGIPVAETHAGKGSLVYDNPLALGGMGVTGTAGANIMAREADLVIGIGTRYSDFIAASKTAFQADDVKFININVAEFDAYKHGALALVADAKVTLEELGEMLEGWQVAEAYRTRAGQFNIEWDAEVDRIYNLEHGPLLSQGEVIGAVNAAAGDGGVILNAAGSMPGDIHKLWRTRHSKQYHMEYGYSCMGYEIAGGLGVKMAAPDEEVYVMVGDASYLMLNSEIVTAVQEGYKLTIVLVDNHGFASIGALSESIGSDGFGTRYKFRGDDGQLSGNNLPIDYAANARSMGADVIEANDLLSFKQALAAAKENENTTVIVVETDREQRVGGYESWWDVPIAEVSEQAEVQEARAKWEQESPNERYYL